MRILIASDHYPPFVGGVQRQTRAIAIELRARGHEVAVATVWQHNQPAFEFTDGFEVHRLRQLRSLPAMPGRRTRKHQPPFPDPVTAICLRRLIRRFKPDVVHSSGWYCYAAAAALLGKRTPLIVSAREYGFSCANASMLRHGDPCSGPGLAKCFECSNSYHGPVLGPVAFAGVRLSAPLLRRRASKIHSVSNYVREIVERDFVRGKGPLPQTVIPSFRLDDGEQPDEEFLARLPTIPFILFVGALRRVKGVQVLYDAYSQLENAPPLVLLGTPEADTPAPPPPGVVLPGPASNATVLAAWDRSLFGVMPSLWPEPFGSVIHEAMSRGKAVIGTKPGGHSDMIDDEINGLLVPAADSGALHAAMQRLITSADLRARLGTAAKVKAHEFTAAVVIPQFEELYMGSATSPS
jgi:glycosyltransferase involved in cell wall biosynthesis